MQQTPDTHRNASDICAEIRAAQVEVNRHAAHVASSPQARAGFAATCDRIRRLRAELDTYHFKPTLDEIHAAIDAAREAS